MRKLWVSSLMTGLLVLGGCGGGGEEPGRDATAPAQDFTPVIATIGDLEITRGYFDFRYENLTPGEKARFSGEDWESRFLDALVAEIVVSMDAEEQNLDRELDVQWRLDKQRRELLFQEYYAKHFQDELAIPEIELRQYYNENKEAFEQLGRARAMHIQTASEEKIREAHQTLEKGWVFGEVAAKYNEDENTRDSNGVLGWVNPGGYVLGIGFEDAFTEALFALEPQQYSEPLKIGDNWHIIKCGTKVPGAIQPFEEARERIERQLRPSFQREAYEDRVDELTERYVVRLQGEFAEEQKRGPEELYRLAGESLNRYAKIDYYLELVELYPEHERADDALFMAGFVASEEIFSPGEAARYYRRLLEEYPDSEFVEDVEFMLRNFAAGRAGLTEEKTPKTSEQAQEKVRSIRQ